MNADVSGQQSWIAISQSARSSSVVASTRMFDSPTPPETQSRATSASGPSTPVTPSHSQILNFPSPTSLVDAFRTCSPLSSFAASDWSVPLSMSRHSGDENQRFGLNLFSMAPSALSSAPMNVAALYSSPPFCPSSMPTPCPNIDFVFTQQPPSTVMAADHFQPGDCCHLKHEEEESWFNDHIDLEGSQGDVEASSSRQMRSQSPSRSYTTDTRLVSGPAGIGWDAFSPSSAGDGRPSGTAAVSRSESVDSGRSFFLPAAAAAERRSSRGRRAPLSSSGDRRYFCSVCNRACDKKYNLREHEKIHDPARISQFLCPWAGCGKRLGRKTDVKRHVQSVHEKEKKFACDKCAKRFDRKDTLAR